MYNRNTKFSLKHVLGALFYTDKKFITMQTDGELTKWITINKLNRERTKYQLETTF